MVTFVNFLIIGLGTGADYALLALGAVLIYRGSGVVNFAQGSMGLVGAATYYELRDHGTVVAVLGALLVGTVFGALVEIVILRNMRHSSPIARMIVTLAIASTIVGAALVKFGADPISVVGFLPGGGFAIGQFSIVYYQLFLLLIAGAVTAILWFVFAHTRWALATTAASENQQVASAAGWSPNLLSLTNWALGGLIAAMAGILLVPLSNLSPDTLYLTVIPALAACVVGSWSFPYVFAAALAIGVLESEATWYISAPGWAEAVPLLFILVVLVWRGRGIPLRSYAADRLPRLGTGRIRPGFVTFVMVATGLSVAFLAPGWSEAVIYTALGGLLGLSVVVIVGYCGQVSLAQYGVAGIAALVTGQFASHGVPVLLSLVLGVLCALPVGLIVALPALRTRGVSLAIVTLSFGTVIAEVVLANPNWTGGLINGLQVPSLTIFGIDFNPVYNPRNFAYMCLAFLLLGSLAAANLRRSRGGLSMIAVRDNERAAASVGVSSTSIKIYAFIVSSALASLGGALFAISSVQVDFSQYTPLNSITVLLLTVIGGLGFIAGGIVGATGLVGAVVYYLLLRYISNSNWFPLITAALAIPVLVSKPDGVVTDFLNLGDRLARFRKKATKSDEVPPESIGVAIDLEGLRNFQIDRSGKNNDAANSSPVRRDKQLILRDLVVRFGTVAAVDHVGIEVSPGEIVGLIGPNGAGKTTLIDAVTGYVSLDEGQVLLGDVRLDKMRAHNRARAGVVRSFQSVELFEDLTIRENILLGDGMIPDRKSLGLDLIWPKTPELAPWAKATATELQLDSLLDCYPRDLSYANRRMVAIARAVAAQPAFLLLDEPAAGLDAPSVRLLGEVIRHLARSRGIGVLLVEHNVAMVLEVSDRVVAIDFGHQIATGTPEEIRLNPAVIDSYLGAPLPNDAGRSIETGEDHFSIGAIDGVQAP